MRGPVIILCTVILIIVFTLLCTEGKPGANVVKSASGVVTSVYTAGSKDAVFKISGIKCAFYIRSGLVNQFDLSTLQHKLIGKRVNIRYADRWTPLDPSCNKSVAEITIGDELLYSELKKNTAE